MEIQPPFPIGPLDPFKKDNDRFSDESDSTEESRENLQRLKLSLENLVDWIAIYATSETKLTEKGLKDFITITDRFYLAYKDLEGLIERKTAKDNLALLLEIHAEVDDLLIGTIKKKSENTFWDIPNFSFLWLMEHGKITPFIDLKRLFIQIFRKVPSSNWQHIIRQCTILFEKLSCYV